MRVMMMRRWVLSVSIGCALTGCASTPQYVRPALPVVNTYAVQGQELVLRTVIEPEAFELGWRQFFQDQRLRTWLNAALKNNRDMQKAVFRIQEARAQYHVQEANQWPAVDLNVANTRSKTPAALSSSGQITVGDHYQVGLGLTAFELDFFGRVRQLSEAALHEYLATEEASRIVRMNLIAQVAQAYWALCALNEQSVLANNILAGRQQTLSWMKQRFDAGASSVLEVRSAEILAQSAQVALLEIQKNRARTENVLTLLVGQPLSGLLEKIPETVPLVEQSITPISTGLPSDLLVRRPDILAAEHALIAAQANIGAARAAFFPRITLTGNIGSASNSLSELLGSGSTAWTFVPQLVIPIFNAGKNNRTLDIAEARSHIAVVEYEKTIQVAFREVSDLLTDGVSLTQQMNAQRVIWEAQKDRLSLMQQRFTQGIANAIEVADVERDVWLAQQALLQTRLAQLVHASELYRALGGGVQEERKVAVLPQ